jgi:hypothetical protein
LFDDFSKISFGSFHLWYRYGEILYGIDCNTDAMTKKIKIIKPNDELELVDATLVISVFVLRILER